MNRYLEKIAFLKHFRGHKERDLLDLAGFAMGGAGLAMGASRTMNTGETTYSAKKKAKLEEQSLTALQNIDKTLKKLPVSGGTKNV